MMTDMKKLMTLAALLTVLNGCATQYVSSIGSRTQILTRINEQSYLLSEYTFIPSGNMFYSHMQLLGSSPLVYLPPDLDARLKTCTEGSEIPLEISGSTRIFVIESEHGQCQAYRSYHTNSGRVAQAFKVFSIPIDVALSPAYLVTMLIVTNQ
jgi:hypothetical protein